MSEVKLNGPLYRVSIIESERGWGQKVDEYKYFTTADEAIKFCAEYNAKNNLSYVPDYYDYASYDGKI